MPAEGRQQPTGLPHVVRQSLLWLKAIRRELAAMDPNLPLGNVRTIEQLLDEAVAPRRSGYRDEV